VLWLPPVVTCADASAGTGASEDLEAIEIHEDLIVDRPLTVENRHVRIAN